MEFQDQEAIRTCSEQAIRWPQVLATIVIGEQRSCKCVQIARGNALQDCKEIRLRDRMRHQRYGQTDGFECIRANQEGTYGESVSPETPHPCQTCITRFTRSGRTPPQTALLKR
jgi:hypothetical protein